MNECVFETYKGFGEYHCRYHNKTYRKKPCSECEQHYSLEEAINHVTPIEQEGE